MLCFGQLAVLPFFGFLRCSEFTVPSAGFQSDVHLTPRDILVDKKPFLDSLVVKLKKSKTDQFKRGFSVVLPRSDSQIFPVSALLADLHLWGPSQGPLFVFQNGTVLTRVKFSKLVRETVLAAGWSGNFTSHSFQVGAASTAASLGVPDYLIKALGRWDSDAYLLYVKLSRHQVATVSRLMALSQPFSPGL